MNYTLGEVTEELERRKETTRDIVIDSDKTWVAPIVPNIQFGIETNDSREYFEIEDWAHQQLADKTGIPWKYYYRMLKGNRGPLLADNINEWIEEKERRLIRIQDNKVRAILSDRYRPLDNYDFLLCALNAFKVHQSDVKIGRVDLSEKHLYLRAILPHDAQEIRHSDYVVPGIILSNSEVGAGSFKIEPFALRLVCQNGLIGDQILRQIHLGERHETGDLWSDETHRKKDEAFWSEIEDVIKATFHPETFTHWFEAFRQASFRRIAAPTESLEAAGIKLRMTAEKRKALLNHFITQGEVTQWGLGNAFSRLGQDEEAPEARVELEQIGSRVSMMPGDAFQKFISPGRAIQSALLEGIEQGRN
jgi:hypothetical protein